MTVTVDARFKLRGALAADAASGNPVPLDREMWVETDQGLTDGKYKLKIGDGVSHYNDLPYVQLGGGVESIVPGDGIAVDDSDPNNPIVSTTLGSIALAGRVATYAALPSSGLSSGDAYLVESDGMIYIWAGSAWPADGDGVSVGNSSVQAITATSATPVSITDTTLPADNTIPQSSEGAAYTDLDVTITPKKAGSVLEVNLDIPLISASHSVTGVRIAIFRTGSAGAIYATLVTPGTSGVPISTKFKVPALSVSASTFTLRVGVNTGTGYFLRNSGTAAIFGGVMKASMTVAELSS